jgi:PAS domain S-box-containing protein
MRDLLDRSDQTGADSNLREAENTLQALAGSLFSPSGEGITNALLGNHSGVKTLAEKGFRMEEARYRTLVELLPAVTFLAAFEEGLSEVYVSPQIESLLGYTQAQWVENPVLWYERLHPDDRERWNTEFAQTVLRGEPLRSTYRFIARDGHVVWIHGEARIVRDEHGVPLFIHGMGFDVTKMKEAEQRVVEYAERLRVINRELEQFAYVASHDLQEPLRTIINYSQLVAEDCKGKLTPETDKFLDRVVRAAQRMKVLIQALLEFSRLGRGGEAFAIADLNKVLSEALANLEGAIHETQAQVTHDVLPSLSVNRTYLVVLFQNLIANGIKFRSKDRPRIHVSAVRSNESWVFSVRDNGLGIDPIYHDRIFVIFQRLHTRDQYPGAGIGLALCKKIVDLHGGRIWVESEPGKGATFKFTLPVTAKPVV